jgi:transducin (beta)-like 1
VGPRKAKGGDSFSSAADNEEDDDDDDGRIPSPPSDDAEEDPFAAKPEEVLKLDKHQSEVFMCAWNPIYTNLIATGSGDASARIWEMNDKYAKAGLKCCTELPHGIETGDRKNKDVTTLEWSTDGLLLATGSYDGIARVWDRKGALIHTLRGHQGPIFSLKWNRRGNFLLSGSYDKTIIVWNLTGASGADGGGGGDGTANGYIEHQFKDHEAPALDVDWKDNTTFASCSTDRTVHIYQVNIDAPLKVYRGHMDEVNAVKWSPSGKYLASCSDDCTAKVWEVDNDRTEPLYDFVNHDQEIYTVKWSPTGPGSPNPSKMPLLATASFDGSIRLWNIHDGSCFGYFNQHRDSVYSVAFSPSGDYLASGSLAGQLYIWEVVGSQYVKSYKGKGDIFEVAWNKEETRVAACFSSNVVAVIDFDRSKLPPITAPPPLIERRFPDDADATT